MSTKVVDCPRCYAINRIPVDLPIRQRVRCAACRRSFRPPPVVPPQRSRRRPPGRPRPKRKKPIVPPALFLPEPTPKANRKRRLLPRLACWLLALALLAGLALLVAGHPTLRQLLPGAGPDTGPQPPSERRADDPHP